MICFYYQRALLDRFIANDKIFDYFFRFQVKLSLLLWCATHRHALWRQSPVCVTIDVTIAWLARKNTKKKFPTFADLCHSLKRELQRRLSPLYATKTKTEQICSMPFNNIWCYFTENEQRQICRSGAWMLQTSSWFEEFHGQSNTVHWGKRKDSLSFFFFHFIEENSSLIFMIKLKST